MSKSITEKILTNNILGVDGQTLRVDLFYPLCEGSINEIEIGLCDVRAVDDIRVSFDHSRNGYVIKQASRDRYNEDGEEQDEDWQEVAYVEAFGRRPSTG